MASEFRWEYAATCVGLLATCWHEGVFLEAFTYGWEITLPNGSKKRGAASVSSYSSNQTRLAANRAAAENAAFREVNKNGG